ncbi:MAG: hypothetical protein V1779_15490 [bacterium]
MKKFIYGIIFILFHSILFSQIPTEISYQGRILDTDGNPVSDGNYLMLFSVWKHATSTDVTNLVFTETQNVNLVNGFFNVNIGSVADMMNVPWGNELWLETKLGDNAPYPRTKLTSVPYSFFTYKAETAIKADIATTVEDGAITQSKLADGVMAIPMGTAGGSLSGEYPNPVIDPQAIIDAIEPGSITQEKLASNITAIPIGEARGDLVGYFPEPTIRPGAIRTEYFAPEVVTEGVLAPDAVITSRIMDDAVTLEKMFNGNKNGQIIWWDTVENNWMYSGGPAPMAPSDDYVLKWNDNGWVEWDKDALYLPYAYSDTTVNDETLFSITKTDVIGSVIAAIVAPSGSITSDAIAIEAIATNGHAIYALNNSSSNSTIYAVNLDTTGYALETMGDANVVGALLVNGETAFVGDFDVDGLTTLSDAVIGGDLEVMGNSLLHGILETEGDVYLYNNMEVDGDVYFYSNLDVSGSQIINGPLQITNTANSTGTGSGALIVAGGAGIGQNLYVGGLTRLTNGTGSTGTGTGALVVTGGTGIGQNLYVGGTANVTGATNIAGITSITNSTVSSLPTNGALVVTGGTGISGALNVAGVSKVTNGTGSTSTGTGAFVVTGGAGIGQNLYVGGTANVAGITSITNSTVSSLPTNGALVVTGGTGISGALNVAGVTKVTNGTSSTSTSTGALVVTGGIGVGGALNVGGTMNVAGLVSLGNVAITGGSINGTTIGATTRSTGAFTTLTANGATTLTAGTGSSSTGTGTLVVTGGTGISENLYVGGLGRLTNSTTSTSTGTGALVVTGGTGIGGNLYVGGTANVSGLSTLSSVAISGGSINNTSIGASTRSSGAFTTLSANGASTLTAGTGSTSTGTGTLVVTGGTGISQNLFVGGTANVAGVTSVTNSTNSTSTGSGALVVSGGAGIGQNLYVGGNLNVAGTLTLPANSITDAMVVDALTINGGTINNTPIGSSTRSSGAFTTLTASGATTLTANTTSGSTSTGTLVVTGGAGISENLNVGGVGKIWNTINAYSPTTGALQVVGGVGIGQALFVGNGINVTGTVTLPNNSITDAMAVNALTIDGGTINNTTIGATTASTGKFTTLQLPSGSTINEFSTDSTLGGNSDLAVPTEQAVKNYVNNHLSSISADNGLTENPDNNFQLGGTLIQGTDINQDGYDMTWNLGGGNFIVGGAPVAGNQKDSKEKLNSGGGTRLIVTSDGNVGIGTDVPTYDLEVAGSQYIWNDLEVDGYTYLYNDLEVNGYTYLYNNLEVNASAEFNYDVTVWGMTTHEGDLDIYGTTWMEDLEVYGYTYLYDNLEVDGSTYLYSDLNVDGQTYLNGGLEISGAMTIDNDLYVTGDLTADGNVVFGDMSDADNVTISNDGTVPALVIYGDTEIGDYAMEVYGISTFWGNLDVWGDYSSDGGDITLNYGDLSVGGTTTLSTTNLTGDLTLSSGASINEFSTDGTLADNSDVAVPTEQAVKTYVDGTIGEISANNGITESSSSFQLGGTLVQNTEIDQNGNNMTWLLSNSSFDIRSVYGEIVLGIESKKEKINSGVGNSAFFVAGNGYVGIGTDVPSYELEVGGSEYIWNDLEVDGYTYLYSDLEVYGSTYLYGTMQLPNGSTIDEFSTDGTLSDNSDYAVPTEQAVKTYVDNAVGVASSFSTVSNLTSNSPGDMAYDDFVFGSNQLDDDSNSDHYNRFFFDKSKGAFRSGYVDGTQWDDANRGENSIAWGANNIASGFGSTAWGDYAEASASFSTAWGYSWATADYATAWGYSAAVGDYSTAWGEGSAANGYATAWGESSASGVYSTAWGAGDAATDYATAWGWSFANGIYSTAFGEAYADGDYSTAWGNAAAYGEYSTAWGNGYVDAPLSTAWGNYAEATGDYATAWGRASAEGDYSTAWGPFTTAESYAQTTLGQYNTAVACTSATGWESGDRLFVIGNGTGYGSESDALVMLKNGNTTLNGDFTVSGVITGDGSGITGVSASSMAFSGITSSTNSTASLVIGSGANLAPDGSGGNIVANKFIMDGVSSTNAVDLATTEVDGELPDANVADNLTISGGTIENTPIGGTTPATGSFASSATLAALTVANTGTGAGVSIDNGTGTGLALSITNSGGAVKLSSGFATVSSNALTIPDDVSIYDITSDENSTEDVITMPAGVEGQILYIAYHSATDNANFGVYTTALAAGLTFVYVNSSWRVVSIIE